MIAVGFVWSGEFSPGVVVVLTGRAAGEIVKPGLTTVAFMLLPQRLDPPEIVLAKA
jgi:hypothetical protein